MNKHVSTRQPHISEPTEQKITGADWPDRDIGKNSFYRDPEELELDIMGIYLETHRVEFDNSADIELH